jgi:hypothetical protein
METEIIRQSKTISEAIKKLYGYYNGKTKRKFDDFVKKNKINVKHLKSKSSKYEIVIKICPVCEKEFETKIGHRSEKTTCSCKCANTYFRSGSSNPNWNENTYRSTCFKYHKKECIICGEYKIVEVHHFDKNKKNNNPDNLIPLCPTHHQYVHSRYENDVKNKILEYRNNFIKNEK